MIKALIYFFILTITLNIAQAGNNLTPRKTDFYIIFNQTLAKKYAIKYAVTEKLPDKLFSISKLVYPETSQCYLGFQMLNTYFIGIPNRAKLRIESSSPSKSLSYNIPGDVFESDPIMNSFHIKIPCDTSFKNSNGVSLVYRFKTKIYKKSLPISIIQRVWSMKKPTPFIEGGNGKYLSVILNSKFWR
ncbi:MAG: hypothetical protein COV52_06210 [Gammaproteobacteria bacterium CG11_big_fil_rev_8_21_14_0_20_46_22]|nr:MAG: hypothetical protein COW05_07450 [Gammaproteobacteria bacterium CG12_big_fil_rev_8_21_14_0_65_46_12]PIR11096.1 MAG: hypothetical protein COV52_06210 [Gammaproteobacteria bacterium CG11_big_fil_rev_8_21_14_0_20_46_22]